LGAFSIFFSVVAAILLMVPGAVGVVGFYELLRADGTGSSGSGFAVDMSIRALSLALGLYLSNLGSIPLRQRGRDTDNDILTL
jgi:uncharacterized membrane protein YjjB (DUF3815 family)